MKGGQVGERRVAAGQGRRSTWRDRAQRRRSSLLQRVSVMAGEEGHISFDQKKFLKVIKVSVLEYKGTRTAVYSDTAREE